MKDTRLLHLSVYALLSAIMAVGLSACSSVSPSGSSQSTPPAFLPEDLTYENSIRTVQLYRSNNEANDPVIIMGRGLPLTLEFDELLPEDQRQSDFFVDIVSCNANWQPSRIAPIQFYEGFTRDPITEFQQSAFTKVTYVHYRYQFPQENERFLMSGNYILKVFRNNNPKQVVLTRRFIVAEPRISINVKNFLDKTLYRDQFSEVIFDILPGNLPITNPQQDFNIQVLQNFRWDNRVGGLSPRFQGNKRFEYYINLENSFYSGNEYRRIDLMSTRFYGEGIRDIEETESLYEVLLVPDKIRRTNQIRGRRDLNGGYGIQVQEYPDSDLNADYVMTYFKLEAKNPLPGTVYIMGKMTDWRTLPNNRMQYNEAQRAYEGALLLKQGVYEYQYGLLRTGDNLVDERELEGPHSFAENYYTILVYYRGPTDRNDRLLGFLPINYVD